MTGYADIELTNVKTGEVKKYHDENMITNGVMHTLSQSPYCFGTFHYNRNQIMKDKPPSWLLMGGLLLFDKRLEENPETLIPPDGVKMVGNAVAGVSNSSGVPEFGNFDAKSSTYEVSGKTAVQKFVYTFDTTQANGTIACVCLGSAHAGYYGFGNHSGQAIANSDDWGFRGNRFPMGGIRFNPSYTNNSNNVSLSKNRQVVLLADYKKNCIVLADDNFQNIKPDTKDAKIILGKIHAPLSKTGVIPLTPYDWGEKNYIYEKAEVPIPDNMVKNIYEYLGKNYAYLADGAKAYIVWFSYLDITKNYSYAINILEVTSDLHTSFKTVPIDRETYERIYSSNWGTIKDDILYVRKIKQEGSERKIYLCGIDINSGREMTMVRFPNDGCRYIGKYMDKIIIENEYKIYFYDTVLKKFSRINTADTEFYHQVKGAKHLMMTNDGCFYTAPLYLATINNLSEPVTKTPELVMKITYTLTTELEA